MWSAALTASRPARGQAPGSRADRQRKTESLPPEWFRRVEHLGCSGWEKLHEAEQAWKAGMAEQGGLLRVPPADRLGPEAQTSKEYLALQPLTLESGCQLIPASPTTQQGVKSAIYHHSRGPDPDDAPRPPPRTATANPLPKGFTSGFLGRSQSARIPATNPASACSAGLSPSKLVKRPVKQQISPNRLDSPKEGQATKVGVPRQYAVAPALDSAAAGAADKDVRRTRWWNLRR